MTRSKPPACPTTHLEYDRLHQEVVDLKRRIEELEQSSGTSPTDKASCAGSTASPEQFRSN